MIAPNPPRLADRHDNVLREHRINPFPLDGLDRAREVARLAREAIALGDTDPVVEDVVEAYLDQFARDPADGLGDVYDPRLADPETFLGERANVLHAVLRGRDARPVLAAEIKVWLLTTGDGEAVVARARAALRGDD